MAATTLNLDDFLIGDGSCQVYRFPNGATASVHCRKGELVRDVWCEALDGDYAYGLTEAQVYETLAGIYRLPGN